jgi:hypothetical protein|tara:strand:+ start:461 stop:697 length:237 start_codon:yes stop_codon:yes gene_type:complete
LELFGWRVLVIDVSQLISVGLVELMDWNVIEVGHQGLSLLNSFVFICFGKVLVLSFVWLLLLILQQRRSLTILLLLLD